MWKDRSAGALDGLDAAAHKPPMTQAIATISIIICG